MDMPIAVHGGRVVQNYNRMRVLERLGSWESATGGGRCVTSQEDLASVDTE